MFDHQRVELDWGGRKLTLETGKIARQADGAVVATYGETTVLATVVSVKEPKPGQDFFPLTVDYQERYYASGRIPGGFFKREGRPTEKEILTSRLIDRPIRPLFPRASSTRRRWSPPCSRTIKENDPDVVAHGRRLGGAHAVGRPLQRADRGRPRRPHRRELRDQPDDRAAEGRRSSTSSSPAPPTPSHGRDRRRKSCPRTWCSVRSCSAHGAIQPVIDAIIRARASRRQASRATFQPADVTRRSSATVLEIAEADLRAAYKKTVKQERYGAVDAVKAKVLGALAPAGAEPRFDKDRSRRLEGPAGEDRPRDILDTGRRIDGRDLTTSARSPARWASCRARTARRSSRAARRRRSSSPRSAPATDEQMIDASEGTTRTSCCTTTSRRIQHGEAGRMGGPAAARSATASSPGAPSTRSCRRATSSPTRCASSPRSSSRTARPRWRRCAARSLSLMDAGVPLKAPVAGIAMGLIKEGESFAVLSDILGDEDHLGDMDFKVAGTRDGITAVQMDIKIQGITARS